MKNIVKKLSMAAQSDKDLCTGVVPLQRKHDVSGSSAVFWIQNLSSVLQCSSSQGLENVSNAESKQQVEYHMKC